MKAVRVVTHEPKQQAVLRTIALADGTVKTIITSEPIPHSIDDAWAALKRGEHEEAAKLFAEHTQESDRGAEAMLGHGLARAMSGDDEAAAESIRRALELDPEILGTFAGHL